MSEPEQTNQEQGEAKAIQTEMKATHEQLIGEIEEIYEKYNISNVCFLATFPESSEPMMFYKGSRLTVARMTALFTRIVKDDINRELAT